MSKQSKEEACERTAHAAKAVPHASVFVSTETPSPSSGTDPTAPLVPERWTEVFESFPSLAVVFRTKPPAKTEEEIQARENLLAKQKETILAKYPPKKSAERQAIV